MANGALYSFWDGVKILGWNFDTVEKVKQAYVNEFGNTLETYMEEYRRDYYRSSIEPLFRDSSIKLNLGGDNEKTKIEFSDRPIGVFDFSLASQQLFRVQEFYSDVLAKEKPDLFKEYELPAGVVPNYFVEKEIQGENSVFYYFDVKENNKYYLEKRQKGLTEAMNEDPTLGAKIISGMLVPDKPTKKVKFSSNTKKPYVKYKRRGGKVKYVEIYSLNYYTRMSSDNFFMAVRHLPAFMVAEYLEKMGTMCKFYITRFVKQTANCVPRKNDILTNAELPLYEDWKTILSGQKRDSLVLQPMCVKEYGTEMDKNFLFLVGSTMSNVYEATYYEMEKNELSNRPRDAYGYPTFNSDDIYQEGFERFRQKFLKYTESGIWKAKELTEQGLIYFHDLVLNKHFESYTKSLQYAVIDAYPNYDADRVTARNNTQNPVDGYTFLMMFTANTSKWFETWLRVSANTIKHKLDIFNSANPRKTYEEVGKELDETIESMEAIIREETYANLEFYFIGWKRFMIAQYKLDNKRQYCVDKINEMTFFAEGGIFPTPEESIEKRNEEAERLLAELDKVYQ